ncbi:MAG: hypothetical protein H8K04_08855 [Nitrospira sp.]
MDDLDLEVDRWLHKNFESITYKQDPKHPDELLVYAFIDDVPIDVSLLIGEVLHSLRGTLDHLAYSLAKVHSGPSFSDDIKKDSEFPIFSAADASLFTKKTRGMSPQAQAAIESLQPYHGTDPTKHILWILNRLSNTDKHRLLLSGALGNRDGVVRRSEGFIISHKEPHIGPLKGNAKIATLRGHFTGEKVDVKYVPYIEVVFDCGCLVDGKDIQSILKDMFSHIGIHVLSRLDEFL